MKGQKDDARKGITEVMLTDQETDACSRSVAHPLITAVRDIKMYTR
jgi:hypothetical protein